MTGLGHSQLSKPVRPAYRCPLNRVCRDKGGEPRRAQSFHGFLPTRTPSVLTSAPPAISTIFAFHLKSYNMRLFQRGSCPHRRPGKNFLTFCGIGRVRSRVRACQYGRCGRWPRCSARIEPPIARTCKCVDPNGFSRSTERPYLHYVVMPSPIR